LPATPVSGIPSGGDHLAELLGARVRRNHFGEHLSLQQWYATPEMCFPEERSVALLLPPSGNGEEFRQAATDPKQWLFLDTETTGLAGGTGTYAFLVGIAWWDAGGLQIEQFFLRDLDEEHSVLLELSERMRERPVLVTFNGKSFDWPLLETRYRMTRSVLACTPRVHLDMLHPARQLWRFRLGSVRLRDLERHILGASGRRLDWSREDDIDSSLIPQMYFEYLRGATAEPLTGVFRHNQMDLRGLAALAGRILALLERGTGIETQANDEMRDSTETFGLSRMLRRRGLIPRARELYEIALRFGLPVHLERLAQCELAQLAKRELDFARAIPLWEALRHVPGPRKHLAAAAENGQRAFETAIEAAEQLAIYYERRARQPVRALELTGTAIIELEGARQAGRITKECAQKLEARLNRRLARLKKRCASHSLFERSPAAGADGRRESRGDRRGTSSH
jgi:uncharacterized protein YprB with RNaseH-like and TPR domain